MRQECNESARERRIALYTSDQPIYILMSVCPLVRSCLQTTAPPPTARLTWCGRNWWGPTPCPARPPSPWPTRPPCTPHSTQPGAAPCCTCVTSPFSSAACRKCRQLSSCPAPTTATSTTRTTISATAAWEGCRRTSEDQPCTSLPESSRHVTQWRPSATTSTCPSCSGWRRAAWRRTSPGRRVRRRVRTTTASTTTTTPTCSRTTRRSRKGSTSLSPSTPATPALALTASGRTRRKVKASEGRWCRRRCCSWRCCCRTSTRPCPRTLTSTSSRPRRGRVVNWRMTFLAACTCSEAALKALPPACSAPPAGHWPWPILTHPPASPVNPPSPAPTRPHPTPLHHHHHLIGRELRHYGADWNTSRTLIGFTNVMKTHRINDILPRHTFSPFSLLEFWPTYCHWYDIQHVWGRETRVIKSSGSCGEFCCLFHCCRHV